MPCVDLPGTINEVTQVVINGQVLDPSAYKIEAYRRLCRTDGQDWPCTNNLGGVHCVNTDSVFTVEVDATAGSWLLQVTLNGVTESFTFAFNEDAAVVQAALDAMYGTGTAVVSGGPGGASGLLPYLLVFDVVALVGVPVVQVSPVGLAGSVGLTVDEAGCLASEGTWSVSYVQGSAPPPGGQLAAAMFACQIALNRCGSGNCVLPQRLKEITREGVRMQMADPLEFLDRGEVGIYEVDLWLKSVNPNGLQRRASVIRADSKRPPTNWTG